MDEERLSILRMVSEGKITAEEGEELLAVLDASEKSEKAETAKQETPSESSTFDKSGFEFPFPDVGNIVSEAMQNIPDVGKIVSDAMHQAFKGSFRGSLDPEHQTIEPIQGSKLSISSNGGGDVVISGTTETTLSVHGRCALSQNNSNIVISEDQGEDLTIEMPESVTSISVGNRGGGDISFKMTDTASKSISLHSEGGGDITTELGNVASMKLGLSSPGGGDASLKVGNIESTEISASSPGGGDITLRLPESVPFEISASAIGGGDISSDLTIDVIERTENSIVGKRHGGGANRIALSAPGGGDISLKVRD